MASLNGIDIKSLLSCVDLTQLNALDNEQSTLRLFQKAQELKKRNLQPASICVYASTLTKDMVSTAPTAIAVVTGYFPSGQAALDVKVNEVKSCLELGVDEVDFVINRGHVNSASFDLIANEVASVKAVLNANQKLKVIIETCDLLRPGQIGATCEAVILGGADFIKTSTGKGAYGARLEDVAIMLDVMSGAANQIGLKVSGGIRTAEEASNFANLWQTRTGNDINPNQFRIGASSLVSSLLEKIDANYFDWY